MLSTIEKLNCTTISGVYFLILGGVMAYTLYSMRIMKGTDQYNALIGIMAVSLFLVLTYNHMSCTKRTKVASTLFPFLVMTIPLFSVLSSMSFLTVTDKIMPGTSKRLSDSIA